MSQEKNNEAYPINSNHENIVSEPYITWDLDIAVAEIEKGLGTNILSTIQARLRTLHFQVKVTGFGADSSILRVFRRYIHRVPHRWHC